MSGPISEKARAEVIRKLSERASVVYESDYDLSATPDQLETLDTVDRALGCPDSFTSYSLIGLLRSLNAIVKQAERDCSCLDSACRKCATLEHYQAKER